MLTLTTLTKEKPLVFNEKDENGVCKGKCNSYLNMTLDYDSDEEDSGLPPAASYE